MLSKNITDLLNDQLSLEAYASNFYLATACWCEAKGLFGCAKFLYAQASEEREHMMKVIQYINEAGGKVIIPSVKQPPSEFKSLRDILENSLKNEIEVTQYVHKIVDTSLSEKDYTTFNFLQWFVEEQLEEENQFRTLIEKINMIGEEGRSLYLLDKELGKRAE